LIFCFFFIKKKEKKENMVLLKKILVLFLTAAAMVAAYFVYRFLKEKINPRKSFGHFILFVFVNMVVIFGFILLLSFILFQFRDFFFEA